MMKRARNSSRSGALSKGHQERQEPPEARRNRAAQDYKVAYGDCVNTGRSYSLSALRSVLAALLGWTFSGLRSKITDHPLDGTSLNRSEPAWLLRLPCG